MPLLVGAPYPQKGTPLLVGEGKYEAGKGRYKNETEYARWRVLMAYETSNGITVFHHLIPYKVRGIADTQERHEIDLKGRPELAEATVLIDLTPEQLTALHEYLEYYFNG